jgi:hypothetical protein
LFHHTSIGILFPTLCYYKQTCWNIHMHVFCEPNKFLFFWDKCPGVQLVGHIVVTYLFFKETDKMYSRIAVPLYIPLTIYDWLNFFTLSTAFLLSLS